eukprot:gene4966-3564_t
MQIFVKTPAGKTVALRLNGVETVADVKELAASQGANLFYAGNLLEDAELFGSYGVQSEATIDAVVPVEGGKGKKKKKKIFTKPKKPTHRHKCEKMRALKYFKVTEKDDGSYKVERTRRECANPTCGSGVFLAKHKDREYCGKCHLTFKSK